MSATGEYRLPKIDFLTEIMETSPLPIKFAGQLNLSAPWGIALPEGFAAVCCVAGGRCHLSVDGDGSPVAIGTGDVFVLSPAASHQLQHGLDSPVVPVADLLESLRSGDRAISISGAGGPFSMLVGGLLEFNGNGFCPLQWMLPPVIHLRRQEVEQSRLFESIILLLEQELAVTRPGQRGLLNRLVEILFIRAVQVGLLGTEHDCESAMQGLMHPDLAMTLTLIHREPDKPWTVSALAERAAMSRSTFSSTFAKVLGKPPLQYLRDHRMQVAGRLLRNPALGLKEIASRVGYDSTSAFSTAFKRATGEHPSGYRRRGSHGDAS